MAEKVPNIHTAGFIYVNDATGQAANRAYRAAGEKKGWLVRSEGYERGVVEFAPLCTKVAATKPQLVFLMAPPPGDAHKICKGLRELGYKGPIAQAGAFIMEELHKMLGDNVGEVYHLSGNGERPYVNDDYVAFYSEFSRRYGERAWTSKELEGYSWVKMYVEAIERTQSFDSTVIRNLLATPGKEWYHLSGGKKCYSITEQIAKEMGIGSSRLFNVVWQLGTWDNVAKKQVNVGWIYPYGWSGGKLPK
jgi:ABC-type branched-subunit amino acid transport system substrate-binding protein